MISIAIEKIIKKNCFSETKTPQYHLNKKVVLNSDLRTYCTAEL